MRHNTVKLQMRTCKTPCGSHDVYQIQIPKAFILEKSWKKGDVLLIRSRLDSPSITIRRFSDV